MAAQALANIPADVTPWLEDGLSRHSAGDLAGAEALFRRAAETAPNDPTALYLLGLTCFEAGSAAEAIDLMDRVVALRPDHAQARLTLANLRAWRGELPAAAEDYRRVLELEPGRLEALVGLSQTLRAAGDSAGALSAAKSAVAVNGEDGAALLALAAALAGAGRQDDAVWAYRAAIGLAGETSAAHTGLALTLFQAGACDEALASAERAALLDDGSPDAWFALGAVRRAVGQPREAAEALARSIDLAPDRAAAHLSLGAACVELEDFAAAETHLLRAIDLDPASAEAHANLSSLYCRAEQWDRTRDHALRALALDPELIVAHQNLAGFLAREGRHEEARRHRDHAYGVTNLFVVAAAKPVQRVLMLTTTESGNVPERHLLPAARYTRLNWFIEYARPEQMQTLPPYDVVFNAIGDADLTGPTARNTERFLEVCERPLFNHPDRVQRTQRHLAPTLFGDLSGVVTPAVARIGPEELAEHGLLGAAARSGVGVPLLVRPIGSHGGQGLTLITDQSSEADIAAAVNPGHAHYATAFCDFCRADGLYRKYRMIFVNREPYPYHLAIGDDWMVHYDNSGTADHPERLAEERRFLENPEAMLGAPAMDAVRAIGRRLDLDFAGVDFSLLDDGRVLLFEANATMLVHPEAPDGPLAHKNPYVERILAAFQSMLAGGASAVQSLGPRLEATNEPSDSLLRIGGEQSVQQA
jgi:tetratricopeptide (TPR) repeat protein